MKASETIIAWNSGAYSREGLAPPGSLSVGPLRSEGKADWTVHYMYSGGAAHMSRRSMDGLEQRFHVMRDYYELVYGFGLDPFVVHTAFLHIDEYQEIIKEMGLGPDKGEHGHDPNVGYGRAGDFKKPEIEVQMVGETVHVWPKANA